MSSAYDTLPAHAFWRSGVVEQPPNAVSALYTPKFSVSKETAIMTAGSCFAQHVHRNLAARGWNVLDSETPNGKFPREALGRFGYGLYSGRYGNIYTVRQMVQLLEEAAGERTLAHDVWQLPNGNFVDAQRPTVEPDGLANADHVRDSRAAHLASVCTLLTEVDTLVFTLGLTESWRHWPSGTVYPTAPGTIATPPDGATIGFHNFTHSEILEDLDALRAIGKAMSPDFKLLLTVSPVPLTATASGGHVLSASTYSKAVLRAAAGEFAGLFEDVDYFPSFEVITNPSARSGFYAPNLRSVESAGVDAAMALFFGAHDAGAAPAVDMPFATRSESAVEWDGDWEGDDDIVCEETLLDARNRGRP